MNRLRELVIAGCVVLAPVGAHAQPDARAGDPASSDFLRVATDENGAAVSLQTSIVSFRSADGDREGLVVDLVSAVHIGDAAYYAELNERFRDYDTVLYELVAPEGTRVPLGGGASGGGVVSGAQVAMTRVLDLEFQLNEIDYTRENLVHADLSPDEVAESMTVRGESLYQYFWKFFGVAMSEYAKDPYGARNVALLAALFSDEPERMLKIQFAAAMLDMDSVTSILEGENGSTLVGERNKRAVGVLVERIRRGDRRLAIFYGAAHMADMAARLETDIGLARGEVVWLDAWDLR